MLFSKGYRTYRTVKLKVMKERHPISGKHRPSLCLDGNKKSFSLQRLLPGKFGDNGLRVF